MFSLNGAAGFYKAPVSKGLLGSALVSSFMFSFPLQHCRSYLHSNAILVLDNKQPWRLLTSKLAFLDLKDLMICSLLIYYFRIFERRFGSKKFASFLLVTSSITIVLEALALCVCKAVDFPLGYLPTGPMCCVFPLFVPYYFDIPRVAVAHILGIPVTGKTFTYMLGLQVACGSAESRISSLCGLIAGALWRSNFLWMQSVLFVPDCVGRLCSATVGHLLVSGAPTGQALPMGATLEIQRQEQLDRLEHQMWQSFSPAAAIDQQAQPHPVNLFRGPGIFGNHFHQPDGLLERRLVENAVLGRNATATVGEGEDPPPGQQVSEDQVRQLMEMGFSQDRVRQALQVTNNDINLATNFLLQEV